MCRGTQARHREAEFGVSFHSISPFLSFTTSTFRITSRAQATKSSILSTVLIGSIISPATGVGFLPISRLIHRQAIPTYQGQPLRIEEEKGR